MNLSRFSPSFDKCSPVSTSSASILMKNYEKFDNFIIAEAPWNLLHRRWRPIKSHSASWMANENIAQSAMSPSLSRLSNVNCPFSSNIQFPLMNSFVSLAVEIYSSRWLFFLPPLAPCPQQPEQENKANRILDGKIVSRSAENSDRKVFS